MKNLFIRQKKTLLAGVLVLSTGFASKAQTVYDIIANSPNHTSLEAAINTANLQSALQDPTASLTVFAPDDAAFNNLATALNTDINGLLANPSLSDILLYHVLGSQVPSSGVTNGLIATPLNSANTLKFTVGSLGVYVNQSKITTVDLQGTNGVVHSCNAVVLPNETVADVAIDQGFSTLVAAVVEARLLPALTDPFATLTVFAPTNAAFDNLAADLNTNLAGLLANPSLSSILLYHVLGATVPSSGVTNGLIATPITTANTLKFTVGTAGTFVNHAKITTVDVQATNGVVHVIDAVVLPSETVADVAIDNGFSTLVAAVVEARLLPALTDPFATLTVFAPTNDAFTTYATALGTNLAGLLASPILEDILLYHVLGVEAPSSSLTNGPVTTLLGQDVTITISGMNVNVNTALVTLADVQADNGVVHVINQVLKPSFANVTELDAVEINAYPNPSTEVIRIEGTTATNYEIINMQGMVVKKGSITNNSIEVKELPAETYMLRIQDNTNVYTTRVTKM